MLPNSSFASELRRRSSFSSTYCGVAKAGESRPFSVGGVSASTKPGTPAPCGHRCGLFFADLFNGQIAPSRRRQTAVFPGGGHRRIRHALFRAETLQLNYRNPGGNLQISVKPSSEATISSVRISRALPACRHRRGGTRVPPLETRPSSREHGLPQTTRISHGS